MYQGVDRKVSCRVWNSRVVLFVHPLLQQNYIPRLAWNPDKVEPLEKNNPERVWNIFGWLVRALVQQVRALTHESTSTQFLAHFVFRHPGPSSKYQETPPAPHASPDSRSSCIFSQVSRKPLYAFNMQRRITQFETEMSFLRRIDAPVYSERRSPEQEPFAASAHMLSNRRAKSECSCLGVI